MSWRNFLTSLILSHREIPVEHKLITCLPRVFPVFSPFSFSSRYLYSMYILLIVSLLVLSTFSCVHLLPKKYALPLSMTFFKHSRFLCCTMLSFGVSTISPKNSSSFNISPTSVIAFIKGWNRHQMKNNIRYKGNTNNTSVIIFLIESQKLPAMVLCLGEPPGRFLLLLFFIHFYSSFCCHFCSSFCCCCYSFHFQAALPPALHSGFSGPWRPPQALSSTPITFDCLCFFIYREHYGFEWGFFYPQAFFTLCSFTDIFLHLWRPPWELAVLPWSLQDFTLILQTQTQPICLFDSQ